jgi:hypothetical protein
MRQIPHPVVIVTTIDVPHVVASGGLEARRLVVPDHWTHADRAEAQSRNDSDAKLQPIPRAMTVSSFTSLSLLPVPRVVFNITQPSRTYSAIVSSCAFNIHVLSGDEHGARLADLFTRGQGHPETHRITSDSSQKGLGILAHLGEYGVQVHGQGQWNEEWEKKLNIPDSHTTEFTAPLLRGRGILHVLKCRLGISQLPHSDLKGYSRQGQVAHSAQNSDIPENHPIGAAIMVGEVHDIASEDKAGTQFALSYADRSYRHAGMPIMDHANPPQRWYSEVQLEDILKKERDLANKKLADAEAKLEQIVRQQT